MMMMSFSQLNSAFVLHPNSTITDDDDDAVGLDKMLVDEIGDVTITNDGR